MPDKGLKERSIRQLSGGERRRVALALALGYAQLATTRGQLRCNLLVLDEASRGLHCVCCSVVGTSMHAGLLHCQDLSVLSVPGLQHDGAALRGYSKCLAKLCVGDAGGVCGSLMHCTAPAAALPSAATQCGAV